MCFKTALLAFLNPDKEHIRTGCCHTSPHHTHAPPHHDVRPRTYNIFSLCTGVSLTSCELLGTFQCRGHRHQIRRMAFVDHSLHGLWRIRGWTSNSSLVELYQIYSLTVVFVWIKKIPLKLKHLFFTTFVTIWKIINEKYHLNEINSQYLNSYDQCLVVNVSQCSVKMVVAVSLTSVGQLSDWMAAL